MFEKSIRFDYVSVLVIFNLILNLSMQNLNKFVEVVQHNKIQRSKVLLLFKL